jgi:hypothetical protein
MLFAAQLWDASELEENGRVYELTIDDLRKINPNTLNCPACKTSRDATIVKDIHDRFEVLELESADVASPWQVSFDRMFDVTNDSGLFRTLEDLIAEGLGRKRFPAHSLM